MPDPARLAALAAAGDPAPADATFAGSDRHARLLPADGWPTGDLAGRAASLLRQQAAGSSWRERENAQRVLGQLGRATASYDHDGDGRPQVTGISMPGALATLDAMLCSSQGGFPPATVVSYRGRSARVLAEVQQCVWAPAGGPPARYALLWFRPATGGSSTRQEEIVPAWELELPPGTIAPWLASPSQGPRTPRPLAMSQATRSSPIATPTSTPGKAPPARPMPTITTASPEPGRTYHSTAAARALRRPLQR